MRCSFSRYFFQLAVFSKHPFEMWEFNIYMTKNKGAHTIFKEWAKFNAGKDIESFEDFVKIYTFFRKAQASFGVRKKHYYMTSSSESGLDEPSQSTNTQRKNLADVQPSWPHAGPITNIFSIRQGKNLGSLKAWIKSKNLEVCRV